MADTTPLQIPSATLVGWMDLRQTAGDSPDGEWLVFDPDYAGLATPSDLAGPSRMPGERTSAPS